MSLIKRGLVLLVLSACLTACMTNSTPSQAQVELMSPSEKSSQTFAEYKQAFIDEMWRQNPSWALYSGYYNYDDQLPIPDAARRQEQLKLARSALSELQSFDRSKMSDADKTDYDILKNQLESSIWYSVKLKSYEWMPSSYNVAGPFGYILNTDYKPLDERLRVVSRRMQNIPEFYAAAKRNITTPTLVHTGLAIQQNKGALSVFNDALMDKVEASGLSAGEKKEFHARLRTSINAINDYVSWLELKQSELESNGNARSFRLGKDLYAKKYKLDIESDYSADEIYALALKEKEILHNKMEQIADDLWPKYYPGENKPGDRLIVIKKVIDKIALQHTHRDKFVETIRAQIPELEAFAREKDLMFQDPEKPLVVRETPEYQRGFAGASIQAPGPYDKYGNTYYNVTPLDHYNEEQAESYLREYNDYMLQILNIHEAIPGHYTQLVHSNLSPSLVKSILGNGAMVEGWAVYSERMMLEEGYGNQSPELWLMWYKWNMRVVANTILDYSIHVLGMTEAEAMDLMVNQAFQEQAEAEGKWRRARLSSVQLTSYFTGYKEIYALREEQKRRLGDAFSLKEFHNEFLSYGSSPVRSIKALMQAEK